MDGLNTWVSEAVTRVGLVLAFHRRRIRDLIGLPPPQTHRELLRLALQVIADEELGVVADAVIHAGHPLRVVLVEDFGLRVVEAAGRRSDWRSAAGYSFISACMFGSIMRLRE